MFIFFYDEGQKFLGHIKFQISKIDNVKML